MLVSNKIKKLNIRLNTDIVNSVKETYQLLDSHSTEIEYPQTQFVHCPHHRTQH